VICLALLIFCLIEREVRRNLAPDTEIRGFYINDHRPRKPTGRLILQALDELRLIPAPRDELATIAQPGYLQTQLLQLLHVDPTQTPLAMKATTQPHVRKTGLAGLAHDASKHRPIRTPIQRGHRSGTRALTSTNVAVPANVGGDGAFLQIYDVPRHGDRPAPRPRFRWSAGVKSRVWVRRGAGRRTPPSAHGDAPAFPAGCVAALA
jgi:hypothetical protein